MSIVHNFILMCGQTERERQRESNKEKEKRKLIRNRNRNGTSEKLSYIHKLKASRYKRILP